MEVAVVAEVEPFYVLCFFVANLEGPRLKDDDVMILAGNQVLDIEGIGAVELHTACAPLLAEMAVHATQSAGESKNLGLAQEELIGAA